MRRHGPPLLFDANNNPIRWRSADADGRGTTLHPGVVQYVYDRVSDDLNRADAAADDSLIGDNLPAAGLVVFDRGGGAAGDWNRADAASDDTLSGDNILATGLMGFDPGVALWNRLRVASDDAVTREQVLLAVPGVYDRAAGDVNRADEANADALGPIGIPASGSMLFNGTTFDRQRNIVKKTLLTSAARTASVDSSTQTLYNAKGLMIFVNVTASAATPAVTPSLVCLDPVSAAEYVVWTAAAAITDVTGAGLYGYLISPSDVTAMPGGIVDEEFNGLPIGDYILRMTAADADSLTYSVGAVELL